MKKAYNTLQYGVFIDQQKAHVVSIDEKNKIVSTTLRNAPVHQRFKGEATTKTGMLGHTLNRQRQQQNREHEYFRKFCKTVANQLKKANQVLIFGPADAKYLLHQEMEKMKTLKQLYVVIGRSAPLTRAEAERKVKQYYKVKP